MRATSLALVALYLSVPVTTQAAIINGDFETGDLTGWNVVFGGGPVVSVPEIDGSKKLVLSRSDPPAPGGGLAEVYQDFTIAEKGSISLEYGGEFLAGLYAQANFLEVNFSIAIIRDPDTKNQTFLVGASEEFTDDELVTIPPTTISVDVEPGNYRVFFNVFADWLEEAITPGTATLIVDDVQFTPIPEPATMVQSLVGLVALAIFARRCR